MEQNSLVVVAMAERCRDLLERATDAQPELPQALHPRHLLWMCDRLREHAEDWPDIRLHRWIGFVQAGLLANRIVDFDGAKSMFDAVRQSFGDQVDDADLVDHLDAASTFRMELGGQG